MTKTIKLNEIEHFFRDGSKVPDDYWKTFVNSENNYSKNEDMWDGEELVLKKWKLEEILEKYSPPNPSWNGRSCNYDLPRAGFEDVGSIDLRIHIWNYQNSNQRNHKNQEKQAFHQMVLFWYLIRLLYFFTISANS